MKIKKLILKSGLSPGDIVTMTAAVRDLHAAFPGKYLTDVRTPCPAIWEHNPLITPIEEKDAQVIEMQYPLIHKSNSLPVHFIDGYRDFLEDRLNRKIPRRAFKGDIYIGDEEKAWMSQVQQITKEPTRFWIVVSGGKFDFTAKWWDNERYQEVVDALKGKVQFVQVGEKGHNHPALKDVIDLRGKTDLRQLIRLVYHADGVLCPVTSLMHLAAAVPWKHGDGLRPCVVLAGGREPSHWEKYPGHTFFDSIGKLDCCAKGGCWKSRVVAIDDGSKHNGSLCERPVEIRPQTFLPACLNRITSAEVVAAIESYAQPLEPKAQPATLPAGCCGSGHGHLKSTDPIIWGPRKWAELHNRVDLIREIVPVTEVNWLTNFADTIPCEECKADFKLLLIDNPPDFTDRETYFAWTVAMHNLVNKKIGHEQFPLEKAKAKRNWARGVLDRKKICFKGLDGSTPCPNFHAATEHTGPRCGINNLPISECARHHCPIGNWRHPDEPVHPLGVVIGTYGSVPYIHLHLESRKRNNPDVPYLVIDDGSPRSAEIAELCSKYGAEFSCNAKREGHVPGDMLVFVNGHQWAREKRIGLLVKMSRRWIPLVPWADDLLALWKDSHATTLNARCHGHGFGFRSECVAMDVKAWTPDDVLQPLHEKIVESRVRLTPETPIWAQPHDGLLVEGIVHRAAAQASAHGDRIWKTYMAANPPEQGTGHYAKWPFLGDNRRKKQDNYLWHEWCTLKRYMAQLADWGVTGYSLEDFSALINPSSNPAVNGYDKLDTTMAK